MTGYPSNWPKISRFIRNRSGGRCECIGECGLHPGKRCEERNHEPARWAKGRVVLTVAHLNHRPEDCRLGNLKAMCNRCHLRYDVELHVQHARASRRAKKAHGDLFQEGTI